MTSGDDDGSTETGQQVTPPAPGAPQPTTAIPQQGQQSAPQWGQQAWSAQPEYQYPQQGQYQYPQQPYPQPGQYQQGQYQYPQQGQYPQPQYQYPQQPPTGQQFAQYPQQFGQPQYGQQPYPQYAQPAAPGGSASRTGLWIGLGAAAVLVIGVILAVLLVGGDTTLDRAAAERGVEQVLTGSYGITGIEDVSCPSDQKVEQGASFTCTLTVQGQPQSVTATFTDSGGKYEVSRPTGR